MTYTDISGDDTENYQNIDELTPSVAGIAVAGLTVVGDDMFREIDTDPDENWQDI